MYVDRGIVAGSMGALFELQALMLRRVREHVEAFPKATTVIHDDDAYQDVTEDTPEEAAEALREAAEDMAEVFAELSLPRAHSKAALLASSREALAEAKTSFS